MRMKILGTILLLLYTSIFRMTAQETFTMRGRVIDKENNRPLPLANIRIKSLKTSTATNAQGKFLFRIPAGTYQLAASIVGYEQAELRVQLQGDTDTVLILMNPLVNQLKDITAVGKSKTSLIREKALPVSVISMDELRGVAGNISDLLSKTTGTQIRMSGAEGSNSRISVRGLEGKRIGYFMDDLALNDNNEYVDINDIPIDFIDRIEVYKGVVPARLGGSAIGGAVNFVMKEYPPKYADFSYTVGSFNTHKANLTFRRNKNGFRGSIGGYYTHADNDYKMELPLQEGRFIRRSHDGFQKLTIGSSLSTNRWWFDKFEIEAIYIASHKKIQGIEYNICHAASHAGIFVLNNHIEKKEFLTHGLHLNMNNAFTFSVFEFTDTATIRHDWDGTSYPAVSAYGGEIAGYDARNRALTCFQRTNLEYAITPSHTISFSSQYRFARGLPKDRLHDKIIGYEAAYPSIMHNWVAALSHEYTSPDRRLANILTGRYYLYSMNTKNVNRFHQMTDVPENIKNRKHDIGICEAVRYRFTQSFLVKASAAHEVRLPASSELIGDGFLVQPSGDLQPERNTSLNMGVIYERDNTYGRLQIEGNAFAMFLKNMIRLTGGTLQYKYENFGKMRTLGIELDAKWDAARWLYLWGNITYQDLRDTRKYQPGSTVPNPTKGSRIPNIPFFFANTGVEFHKEDLFGGKGQNTRLFADCSFVKEYFYNFEQSIYQTRRIPTTFTCNIGAEHSFLARSVFLRLQISNITNRQVFSEFNRPLPGRSYSLKIRYILK